MRSGQGVPRAPHPKQLGQCARVVGIRRAIFDETERDIVLKFVAECEALKLAKTPNGP